MRHIITNLRQEVINNILHKWALEIDELSIDIENGNVMKYQQSSFKQPGAIVNKKNTHRCCTLESEYIYWISHIINCLVINFVYNKGGCYMSKWISITVMLILFLGFSGEKIVKGEALNPSNEAGNETVSPPDLGVYAGNIYTENTIPTVLTHQTYEEQTGSFERIIEEEENNLMKSTFPNESSNRSGISPLKVKQGEKIILAMFIAHGPKSFLLFEPDEIEVKQINSDEKANIEVTTDDVSGHDQITAPKENGNYHYSVVVHWNKPQLQASYIFDVTVR